MRDIIPSLINWHEENRSFVVARVLSTWGSAPRRAGATMLVSDSLEVVGSVSGGCIEGSIIEESASVLENGMSRILEFGVDDEKAWSVGLSCGGKVRVLVEPWSSFEGSGLVETLGSDVPFVLVSRVGEETAKGSVIQNDVQNVIHNTILEDGSMLGERPENADRLRDAALHAFSRRASKETAVDAAAYFFHVFAPRPRLLIIGGADITVRLLTLAGELDFETIVVDPRQVFASGDRFNTEPDHLYVNWPHDILPKIRLDENTYVVLLTHDPKIDDPALHILLNQPVAYIGALGGSRTQKKRKERLLQSGFSDDHLDRIHGPVGLDIGAASPKEIALSIMAEIISVQNGRSLE